MPPYESSRAPQSPWLRGLAPLMRGQSLPAVALGAGLILGLLLGLLIGWVLWPVQWTNAWPQDLSPEARAQYLATVAEAYVYRADEQAAEIARNRLYDLNENLAAEIAAAQAYFAENPQQPNARVHINNLGQLAQALNVQSPDIITDAPPVEEGAPASTPAAEDSAVGNSVRNWVNWILTLLAALVLIGGGLYIIARLSQRRPTPTGGVDYVEEEADGFDEEDDLPVSSMPGRSHFSQPVANPLPTAVPPRRTGGHEGLTPAFDMRRGEDYGFDDETEDEPVAYSRGAALDDMALDDMALDDEAAFDSPYEEPPAATVGLEPKVDERDDAELEDDEPFDSSPALDEEYETAEHPDAEPYTTSLADLEPATPLAGYTLAAGRPARDTLDEPVLKTFTVHYQAGIPDYDQSYSIMDEETGRYIGECGMGVNLKNGILQNNPDNVIALDVWLVDKKQERSYSSQSRVLLCEYVIDNKLEQVFVRERPGDAAPLVPQTGMSFQLEGPNLALDCHVVEAIYTKNGPTKGIFQSVKIDMTVRSKD